MTITAAQQSPPQALLIYLPGAENGELEQLLDTLGFTCAASVHLTSVPAGAQYGVGTGKAAELAAMAQHAGADCIVCDFPITPTQQRNWERLAGIPVFDRHEVILRIFAARAQTKEARLQTELAQLAYALPRLAHLYGDMARLRGGSYGAKGSGETQLELDRRTIRTRIARLRGGIAQIEKERATQRKKRTRTELASCALVGYTNAGKSSLLNALTGSSLLVEDKLFATLDPATRRMAAGRSGSVLITDTVGFIHNLPHTLVDAFKSTLEEACRAELLLIVIDTSDARAEAQYRTVVSVLDEIGACAHKRLLVYNKADASGAHCIPIKQTGGFPAVRVSAKTGAGIERLRQRICALLYGPVREIRVPAQAYGLVAQIRPQSVIYREEWKNGGVYIRLRARAQALALIKSYLIH